MMALAGAGAGGRVAGCVGVFVAVAAAATAGAGGTGGRSCTVWFGNTKKNSFVREKTRARSVNTPGDEMAI